MSTPLGSPTVSALHDNIAKKGSNAYYYAHGSTSTQHIVSYDHPPVRIEESAPAAAAASAPAPRRRTDIGAYAWGDGKKLVTVYVEWPGAETLPAEAVAATLSSSGTAVELAVEPPTADGAPGPGARHVLKLAPLAHAVESATITRRGDQLLLKLKKAAPETTWYELIAGKGLGNPGEEDEDFPSVVPNPLTEE